MAFKHAYWATIFSWFQYSKITKECISEHINYLEKSKSQDIFEPIPYFDSEHLHTHIEIKSEEDNIGKFNSYGSTKYLVDKNISITKYGSLDSTNFNNLDKKSNETYQKSYNNPSNKRFFNYVSNNLSNFVSMILSLINKIMRHYLIMILLI
jgi:hypothetical protein